MHSCRELRLDGEPQPMQPLVFGLLCTLVRHRDRVVSKDELLDELWPDTFVTESSLQKAMSLLRTTLRAGDAEAAIKTLPRQGYRFLNYWVDEEQGMVWCLSEAPDAGAVRDTHAEAHGLLPEEILQVVQGE